MNIILFLLLGFFTSLLFPPYFFIPLGFIIFPALCLIIDKIFINISKIKIFFYILFFAISFFTSFLFWIQNPFFVFDETKNFFYVSAILIVILSIFFSIIFTIFYKYNQLIPTIFFVPIVFVFIEFTYSIIFYGFPWINFSLISSSNSMLAFSLKNFGTLINSYLLLQVFCLPYLLISKINKQIIVYFIIFAFTPLLIVSLYNYLSQSNFEKNQKINVEILQLNFDPNKSIEENKFRLKKIYKTIDNSRADYIFFGENNYPEIVNLNDLNSLQKILKKDQTVVIGGTRKEKDKYFNTLFNINKSDIIYFDKKILVPFGEFLPFRKFLNLFQKISGPFDFTEGNTQRVITVGRDISYIPIICYEIIFYWKLINYYNYDSNFIVNITNDIWFGNHLGPYQHFYLTKLRAMEFNKPIIRISNNGVSGIFDKNGEIIANTLLNKEDKINLTLKINKSPNYYKSHYILKNYFIIVCLFLFLSNFIKFYGKKRI